MASAVSRGPSIVALVALLVAAPIGLALSADDEATNAGGEDVELSGATPVENAERSDPQLSAIARRAGCRLTKYGPDQQSNPPVSGAVDERVTARDGSYVGRRPPSDLAAMHAMNHGSVLFQYRPDLPPSELRRLDDLVRSEGGSVLLFERPLMPDRVAATAYLTLMTCPAVNARTLEALRVFRDRPRGRRPHS